MRHRWLSLILILTLIRGPLLAAAEGGGKTQPAWPSAAETSELWMRVPSQARVKIDGELLRQLLSTASRSPAQQPAGRGMVTFLVHLYEEAELAERERVSASGAERALLVRRLQEVASGSQSGIRAYLERQLSEKRIVRYGSFWIFNGLVVEGDLDTAIQLALRPEVARLRPNRTHRLPIPSRTEVAAVGQSSWGVARVQAPDVWHDLGMTGEGVVVANIDSGVDWTHPALQKGYRGYNAADPSSAVHDYNWFDATGTYPDAPGPRGPQATSAAKHGTHTMGTMVGSPEDGSLVGVAPGARWIAVRAFDNMGETTDEWLHAALQWCLAPTDLDGQNPRPDLAPDIVSNSWGDDNGRDQAFAEDLRALRRGGILLAFAAGNAGPGEATINSPASLPMAFAVGASDQTDQIAGFSSRGPSPWGQTKPEVVAPGVGILSTVPGGLYESGWNGTSMATPHVAGVAALILQAARHMARPEGEQAQSDLPTMTITTTEYLITSTAVDLGLLGADNTYGSGRVDAYQAVSSLLGSGFLTGLAQDEITGEPLPQAWIILRDVATGAQMTVESRDDGTYSAMLAPGVYDVTAEHFGYQTHVVQSVEVLAQTTTRLVLSLHPLPSGTLRGRVTRTTDGQGMVATIAVLGTPLVSAADDRGYYTMTVPAGEYTVRALPAELGHRGALATSVQIREGMVTESNLAFSPAPRILVVDADAWAARGHLENYTRDLTELLYTFESRSILDTSRHTPKAEELALYDLVVWSQPYYSPGYIDAWRELGAYLDQGGRLLISGQDIGFWDGNREEYRGYLHALYTGDDVGLGDLSGTADEILEGIVLQFNTPDSAQNQTSPDGIAVGSAVGRGLLEHSGGVVAGILGDTCVSRTIYLAFGLEGVGPAKARLDTLQRIIAWASQGCDLQEEHFFLPLVLR